jgi:hypothetical protein
MGYRGEEVSTAHGGWGRQTPWQSSSDDYQAGDGGGGAGYGPGDGYAGQGQPGYAGYGQQDERYGAPYGQQPPADPHGQPYRQYDGYEQPSGDAAGGWGAPGDGWGGTPGGYGGQQGYGQGGYGGQQGYGQGEYGYERGGNAGGHPQGGYDPAPASGYGQGSGGYQNPAGGGYPGQADRGYQDVNGGYGQPGGYPAQPPGGGYRALPSGSGGSGGSGSYPAQDAGNDWYGGQPAAASGASFADTGSFRLNGRPDDEYGTGPRGAQRDPARGYPPGPQQEAGQLPTSVIPAVSGPQAGRRSGQQERYDDNAPYQRYQQDGDGYPDPAGRDAYGGYDEYASRANPAGAGGAGRYRGPGYQAPLPSSGLDRDGYDGFQADGDPYQDHYRDDGEPAGPRGPGRNGGQRTGGGPLSGKRLLYAALAVVAVGVVSVAAYVFVLKPQSTAGSPNAGQGALPTGSAQASQQACAKELGIYCHIEARADDPTPLTTAELFPPAFTNETDNTSYSLVSTKVDKTCSGAVIGPALIKQLQANCTQVLRASYVSGDGKIMGTIGVVNMTTTNEAHYAGKVVGQSDFIAPLTAAKGVASKLGNGTGVVEAEYKGHYLILTWSEFVNGAKPTTTAQDKQLEQFSNDLVAGTANIDLTQRMVTGTAPTSSASTSPSATASAKASAAKSS